MSKIFKDIRALKLRDSDGWKSSDSATYGEIKNNYSFIGFVPIDEGSQNSDNESLKPKDWLFEAMLQDAKDVPLKYIIEKTTPRMDKRFRISDKQRRIDYINQLEWCNSTQNAHQFHRPITGDVRTEMKRALKEKEEIYKKFCTHYDEVKAQEKSVAILPLHLTFSRDVFFDNQENKYQLSYSILREAISYLTEKFSELIKKIGKRSAYQHVVAFDRLVLLRDDITPYLHVNFYFEDNDFSDFYLRDIVREWCLLTEYDCRVDYILFQDSLSEMPGEDDTMMEDDWHDRCVYDEAKNIEYHFELNYRNAITPFAQISSKFDYSRLERELSRNKRQYADRPELVAQFNEQLKRVKKIMHSMECHKNYLLSVAKQFIKVPEVNHFTKGKVYYLSSKEKKGTTEKV